jgi:hypothetical protein
MNRKDIETAIEPQVSTGMIIISGSFLMGVLFMYAIGYYMHTTVEIPAADAFNDGHISRTLAQVTLLYFAASIFAGRILFRKFLKTDKAIDPYLVVNNIRTAMLVQLALIEGAALLGAVSFLMGALDGYTHVNTLMWATFLPLLHMVFHVIMINPPKDFILKTFDTYFTA